MAKKNEMKFLTGLKKDFKRHGHYFYKIPDTPISARFMIPKPFDCFIGMFGSYGGLEAKYADSKKDKSVKWNDLRPNQHEGLQDIIDRGGLGYVVYQIKFGRENRMYFWEYREFRRLIWKHKKGAAKVMPMDIVDKMPYVLGKKNKFDVLEYDLTAFEEDWNIAKEIYG